MKCSAILSRSRHWASVNCSDPPSRLVVSVDYPYRVVYFRFVGTHRTYDAIDAGTI